MWIPPISSRSHQCAISSLGRLDGIVTVELLHLPLIGGGTWECLRRGRFAECTCEIALLLISLKGCIVTPEASLACISLRKHFSVCWVLSWPGEYVTLPVTLLSRGDWVMQRAVGLFESCHIISHDIGSRKSIRLSHSKIFLVLSGLLHNLRVSLGSEYVRVLIRLSGSTWLQRVVHKLSIPPNL